MNVMTKIQYGLYVLSSSDGDRDNGCIINTVCQVADNPKRIIVSVNNNNYTCDMIKASKKFNISVLTEDTPFSVFEHFGFKSGREYDKFKMKDNIFRSENGIYVYNKYTNSYISGEVIESIDMGSHTLFIASVTGGYVFNDSPTLTYAFYHQNIKPKPKKEKKTGYRCEICGYVYEGEELPEDYICPICKHGVSDFVKLEG